MSNYSQEWRRQCEAREWIKRTKGSPQAVEALLKRIASKRGQAAADLLRQDMREAWAAAKAARSGDAGARQAAASTSNSA